MSTNPGMHQKHLVLFALIWWQMMVGSNEITHESVAVHTHDLALPSRCQFDRHEPVVLVGGTPDAGTRAIHELMTAIGVCIHHGFHESHDIRLQEIVQAAWADNPLSLNVVNITSEHLLLLCDQVATFLKSSVAESNTCRYYSGWKNPRNMFLMRQYFRLFGKQLRFIQVFRNIRDLDQRWKVKHLRKDVIQHPFSELSLSGIQMGFDPTEFKSNFRSHQLLDTINAEYDRVGQQNGLLLGGSAYFQVCIEDLVYPTHREETVLGLLKFLGFVHKEPYTQDEQDLIARTIKWVAEEIEPHATSYGYNGVGNSRCGYIGTKPTLLQHAYDILIRYADRLKLIAFSYRFLAMVIIIANIGIMGYIYRKIPGSQCTSKKKIRINGV